MIAIHHTKDNSKHPFLPKVERAVSFFESLSIPRRLKKWDIIDAIVQWEKLTGFKSTDAEFYCQKVKIGNLETTDVELGKVWGGKAVRKAFHVLHADSVVWKLFVKKVNTTVDEEMINLMVLEIYCSQ